MSGAPVCRYFVQSGKCFYGSECKFSHDVSTQSITPQTSDIPASAIHTNATTTPPVTTTTTTTVSSSIPSSDSQTVAAAVALPQSSPKSSLVAHAKEWTPSASSSSASTPPLTSTTTNPPSTLSTTSSSPLPTSKLAALKLNPNKTPFKPGGASATAKPFYPSSEIQEFVPAAQQQQQQQQQLGDEDDVTQQQLDPETGLPLTGDEVYDDEDDDEQQYLDAEGGMNDSSHLNPYHQDQSNVSGGVDSTVVSGISTYTPSIMSSVEFNESLHPKTYEELAQLSGGSAHTSLLSRNSAAASASSSSSSSGASISISSASSGGSGISPFLDEPLRARFTLASHLNTARLLPEDPVFASLPLTLDQEHYHSLLPLPSDLPPLIPSSASADSSTSLVYTRTVGGSVSYKVTSAYDGKCYVIKRLPLLSANASHTNEDFYRDALLNWMDFSASFGSHTMPSSFQPCLSRKWGSGSKHPNLIAPRGVFLTKDFGSEFPSGIYTGSMTAPNASVLSQVSICVVYDYHPTAGPLFPPPEGHSLPYELIWHYILQLIQILADLHEHALTAHSSNLLTYGRILITNDQKIHLSCSGINEIIKGSLLPQLSDAELAQSQLQDYQQLAVLVISWLGYTSNVLNVGYNNIDGVFKTIQDELATKLGSQQADLLALLAILSHAGSVTNTVTTPVQMQAKIHSTIYKRISASLRTSALHVEYTENELSKETQNGRLFRLLVKFGFVSERPDLSGQSWSETGDRYLLTLFRDLLFHSMHTTEVPNIDWGHVIHNLNKLDAGSPEKLLLSSRNGESMLLVRFSDLKRCVEISYEELVRKQAEGLGAAGHVIAVARHHQQQHQQQHQHHTHTHSLRTGKPSIMQREK